jgi:hypothetical protein
MAAAIKKLGVDKRTDMNGHTLDGNAPLALQTQYDPVLPALEVTFAFLSSGVDLSNH